MYQFSKLINCYRFVIYAENCICKDKLVENPKILVQEVIENRHIFKTTSLFFLLQDLQEFLREDLMYKPYPYDVRTMR